MCVFCLSVVFSAVISYINVTIRYQPLCVCFVCPLFWVLLVYIHPCDWETNLCAIAFSLSIVLGALYNYTPMWLWDTNLYEFVAVYCFEWCYTSMWLWNTNQVGLLSACPLFWVHCTYIHATMSIASVLLYYTSMWPWNASQVGLLSDCPLFWV